MRDDVYYNRLNFKPQITERAKNLDNKTKQDIECRVKEKAQMKIQ